MKRIVCRRAGVSSSSPRSPLPRWSPFSPPDVLPDVCLSSTADATPRRPCVACPSIWSVRPRRLCVPSLRAMFVFLLLLLMELLAAFSFLVGSGLIVAVHAGNAVLGLLFLAGAGGLVSGLAIALIGAAEPWNRILQLVGAGLWAILPAALAGHDFAGITVAVALLLVAYWRGL